jgi:chitin disaccharide deacetylase
VAIAAVIVNADDLGFSQAVNEATFDLVAAGRISSATIMANAPATDEAARRAARFPRCSFGVHLNLTQFEPLTTGRGADLLVDGHGEMSRANETTRAGPALLRAVYLEFCAQIERVASLGVRISHLDSHHHVHTRPFVFPVLKAVQKRYRLHRVRLSKNFYSTDRPCPAARALRKGTFNWALRSIYYPTRTTDAFTEFLTWHHADASRKRSLRLIELMVHPGAPYAAEEAALLRTDWLRQADARAALISYAQLG